MCYSPTLAAQFAALYNAARADAVSIAISGWVPLKPEEGPAEYRAVEGLQGFLIGKPVALDNTRPGTYNPTPMTEEDATRVLESGSLEGWSEQRTVWLSVTDGMLVCDDYDRYHGAGLSAKVLASLLETGDVNNPTIVALHRENTRKTLLEFRQKVEEMGEDALRVPGILQVIQDTLLLVA